MRINPAFALFLLSLLATSFAQALPNNCADCGEGGWQPMNLSCGKAVINKSEFKACLSTFPWTGIDKEPHVEMEMEEGYLQLGKMTRLKSPEPKAFKVIFYHQWAVDHDGKLYLLGQLG